MTITPIPAFKDNYIWALIQPDNGFVWVVDPGDAVPVICFLKENKLTLSGILVTHHHRDHSGGVADLKEKYDVPVYASQSEKISGTTHPVKEGDEIKLPEINLTLRVMEIPGHTLEHVAYYGEEILFCGDTLFSAGCGRVFEGTMTQMYASLCRLRSLPNNTKIYCGHEYTLQNLNFSETVEPDNQKIKQRIQHVREIRNQHLPSLPSVLIEEKETNPFFRCEIPAVITAAEKQAGKPLITPIQVFTCLREWKNGF